MSELLQDLRLAVRQLRKSPGFTLAATSCLALGIGANTVAFSFAWGMLYDAPPVEGPERLVRLFTKWEDGSTSVLATLLPAFRAARLDPVLGLRAE